MLRLSAARVRGRARLFGRLPDAIRSAFALACAFALGGCLATGSAGAAVVPLPHVATTTASTAPVVDDLTDADWARVEELLHLLDQQGSRVWAGWNADVPVLLESAAADLLIGDASPPDGFEPVPGLSVAGHTVLRRAGHEAAGIGLQPVGDQLGLVLLTLPRMQELFDSLLGPGVIPLDDVQYVRFAAHEAFHAFQIGAVGGDPPRFGFEGDEQEMARALGSAEGFGEQLAGEGRLLRDALGKEGSDELRNATKAFLAARAERRAVLPAETAGFEQAVEWMEGLARYSDVRLLQAAAESTYQPCPSFLGLGPGYPSAEETWTSALGWLDDLSSVPGTVRDRYYELGAGQAYLLDRLLPGWHAAALPGGTSLESLLERAAQ